MPRTETFARAALVGRRPTSDSWTLFLAESVGAFGKEHCARRICERVVSLADAGLDLAKDPQGLLALITSR